MTFPAAASNSLNTTGWSASGTNGSIPAMANNTQDTVSSALKQQIAASPNWKGVTTTFQNGLQASQDNLMGNLVQSIANVDINVLGFDIRPFAFLQDWATNLHDQAQTAAANISTISTGISGSSDTTQVAPTVTGMQQNISANASAIAALQTSTTSVGGAYISESFSTPSTGNIGAGWTLFSPSYGGTWEVVAGSGAGTAWTSGSASSLNVALATSPGATMQTDGHQATVVVGSSPNGHASSGLIVRAAANLSTFVYAALTDSQAEIGYATWNGSAFTPTPWVDEPITLPQGATVTLTATGPNYVLTVNGATVAAHTDAAVNSPVGSANRSVGFMVNLNPYFNGQFTGWFANSFNASDVTPPAVIGTGWSLYRSATGSVSVPGSGGWGGVGSTTFDTEANVSSNINVVSLGYGVVQVPTEGFYSLSVGAGFYSSAGNSTLAAGLYLRPAATGVLTLVRRGQDTSSYSWNVAFTDCLYLKAGDQVSPAVKSNGSGTSLIGDVAGSNTFFDGVLVSKP